MIDHRKLGRELELFQTDPLVGAGLPIWLPAGAAARYAVESYIREEERRAGYHHVYSPPLAKKEMYRRSGHLAHFADDMFPAMPDGSGEDELMLRPSLCPHHAVVYKSTGRSYRELPLRIAELGGMFRSERSGVLGGLSRVRAIWLNDAHIFCTPDQVSEEVARTLAMVQRAHAALGFAADGYRLSLRGTGGKFAGSDEAWDVGESMLRAALVAAGVKFVEESGEAAFYGPKIDIQVVDAAGREFTLSTIQVDFFQPERFDLSYVDSAGEKQRPVMVHRSVIGGLERLFAHLIEVHEGAFPAWYAPVQVSVLPQGPAAGDAVVSFERRCVAAGLRAEVRSEGSLALRVREAARRRVPYVAIIGDREVADGTVALRLRDGSSLPPHPVEDALAVIREAAAVPH